MVARRYGISLPRLTRYLTRSLHSPRELSSWTLKKKFHIYACSCIILYLSFKLRCYTRISNSEKSRNNLGGKKWYFSRVFDIANQLLARHSHWPSQSMVVSRNSLGLWLPTHLKISIAYRKWRSKFSIAGKEHKIRKEKTGSFVPSVFGDDISRRCF